MTVVSAVVYQNASVDLDTVFCSTPLVHTAISPGGILCAPRLTVHRHLQQKKISEIVRKIVQVETEITNLLDLYQ